MSRLRILCLHGYHGSAEILRRQLAPLAAALSARAEFVCVDAPSLAHGDFGWWHAVEAARPGRGDAGVRERPARYVGWPRTRRWATSLLGAEGFDGLFGFSQGAALAALLAGLRVARDQPGAGQPPQFGFAMMAGGFLANDPVLARLLDPPGGFGLPSLHMIGRADAIVPAPLSQRLASRFREATIAGHDGGHVIAHDARTVATVEAFLARQARARLSA